MPEEASHAQNRINSELTDRHSEVVKQAALLEQVTSDEPAAMARALLLASAWLEQDTPAGFLDQANTLDDEGQQRAARHSSMLLDATRNGKYLDFDDATLDAVDRVTIHREKARAMQRTRVWNPNREVLRRSVAHSSLAKFTVRLWSELLQMLVIKIRWHNLGF